MKVLVTGASGYIGRKLCFALKNAGHEVYALVRSEKRFPHVDHVIVGDLAKEPVDMPEVDVAYYLIHSLAAPEKSFYATEMETADHFVKSVKAKQIIYLGGLISDQHLSPHLRSRREVEKRLKKAHIPLTIFRAGIIVGAGGASFEIMRDLVERLPSMVTPSWVGKKCQPIAIRDMIFLLGYAAGNRDFYNRDFDVGGSEIFTYRELLLNLARFRHLDRHIVVLPLLTPRLSSYWLVLITRVKYSIARALIDSVKNNAVCTNRAIDAVVPHQYLTYQEALGHAFSFLESDDAALSYEEALAAGNIEDLQHLFHTPSVATSAVAGRAEVEGISCDDIAAALGKKGWVPTWWIWICRGIADEVVGGVGSQEKRATLDKVSIGDIIDGWRVLIIEREPCRIVLMTVMKVPGEEYLEIRYNHHQITTRVVFRPKGIHGRAYWWFFFPIHKLFFSWWAKCIKKVIERSSIT